MNGRLLICEFPEIAKSWDYDKNFASIEIVKSGSNKKAWWKCLIADDHSWEASPNTRTRGKGCPCCSGLKVVTSNCLATTHPELKKQWHPTKNGSLTPNDITAGSKKKVWWKCSVAVDHEWEAPPNNRTCGNGCPCCSGFKVVTSNCLATTHPELCKEWHSTKNGTLTPYNVNAGSKKKIWWKCLVVEDHEWKTSLNNRTKGTGCPCCVGQKVVSSNCLATIHPELEKQWCYTMVAGVHFVVSQKAKIGSFLF